MSTRVQRANKIRSTFVAFLFFYTSPSAIFVLVRWIVNKVIIIWNWFPTLRTTASTSNWFPTHHTTASTGSTSAAPCVLASLCALAMIFFATLAEYLAVDPVQTPELIDPVFLIFTVMQIHFFIAVMVGEIYALPNYMLLATAIVTYPITHVFMHKKIMSVGASTAHLGYFASASSMFQSSITLTQVKALFLFEARDAEKARRRLMETSMDGKNANTS